MENHEILELVRKKNRIINDVENRCKADPNVDGQMLLSFKHQCAAIINEMTDEEIQECSTLSRAIKVALED